MFRCLAVGEALDYLSALEGQYFFYSPIYRTDCFWFYKPLRDHNALDFFSSGWGFWGNALEVFSGKPTCVALWKPAADPLLQFRVLFILDFSLSRALQENPAFVCSRCLLWNGKTVSLMRLWVSLMLVNQQPIKLMALRATPGRQNI